DVMTISGTTGYAKLSMENVQLRFDRIQPGEKLAVTWWIRNDGPCPLDVIVTFTGPSWLNIRFYSGSGLSFPMGSGLAKNVAVTVEMFPSTSFTTEHADESFEVTVTFNSAANGTRYDGIPPVGDR
ncbi:unnamed protein product, partial [marine sediment metagenome]